MLNIFVRLFGASASKPQPGHVNSPMRLTAPQPGFSIRTHLKEIAEGDRATGLVRIAVLQSQLECEKQANAALLQDNVALETRLSDELRQQKARCEALENELGQEKVRSALAEISSKQAASELHALKTQIEHDSKQQDDESRQAALEAQGATRKLAKAEKSLANAQKEITKLQQRCDNFQFQIDCTSAFDSAFNDDDNDEQTEELRQTKQDLNNALQSLQEERARETPASMMLDLIAELECILGEKAQHSLLGLHDPQREDLNRQARVHAWSVAADERWMQQLALLKAKVQGAHEYKIMGDSMSMRMGDGAEFDVYRDGGAERQTDDGGERASSNEAGEGACEYAQGGSFDIVMR